MMTSTALIAKEVSIKKTASFSTNGGGEMPNKKKGTNMTRRIDKLPKIRPPNNGMKPHLGNLRYNKNRINHAIKMLTVIPTNIFPISNGESRSKA